MVRTGGLTYTCRPRAEIGRRIDDLRVGGTPIDPNRRYRVAGWASVQEDAQDGVPAWEPVMEFLRSRRTIRQPRTNTPRMA